MSNSEMNLKQGVGLQVLKAPVLCSKCGELRRQVERCENCGFEKPYSEEKNDS